MRSVTKLPLRAAVTLLVTVTALTGAARDRVLAAHQVGRERGASALEWAIMAAAVVALMAIVVVKITAAVTSHVSQIK